MTDKPALGFIGLGRMGAPMARRLLDAGYALTLFDTSEQALAPLLEQGAQRAASPAAVADAVEIALLSLPTPEIVLAVAGGPGGLIEGGKLRAVIDLSTTGPKGSQALAALLAGHDIGTVDAPVSGGVAGAAKGTLAIMAAGEASLLEELRPVLECFGRVFVAGAEPGMGQTIKVINNLMSVTALAIASEALVLGRASGLDADAMMEIINASSGRSNATEDKFPRFVLPRGFDFGFALGLSDKDTRLCLEHADALGMPMIVGSAARQVLKIALATQGAEGDLTSIVKPLESWMGVEVKGRKAEEK
jgi:2-hydroxy-3-oxopropionate reductase